MRLGKERARVMMWSLVKFSDISRRVRSRSKRRQVILLTSRSRTSDIASSPSAQRERDVNVPESLGSELWNAEADG